MAEAFFVLGDEESLEESFLSEVFLLALSVELEELEELEELLLLEPSPFEPFEPFEYPWSYQPPPLRWNDVREISFSSLPEHSAHLRNGRSLIFWSTSVTAPHPWQRYS